MEELTALIVSAVSDAKSRPVTVYFAVPAARFVVKTALCVDGASVAAAAAFAGVLTKENVRNKEANTNTSKLLM